ncbi:uncharacterized protein BX663DRAFT_550145 [Cokeromyces recurvatus]|uniref:uncharacterized protein n=1 Tax=Cokeromyces recurvatus TaxID=90255 RepID=UPI00221E729E|nr:uncharacterized protein BX663DRAFT_550145 [Cokeromyces recurvatus]KAI7905337.1 hypothetical protein BX663DRAFT_550145 [Cokeromyces recurvatus]
MSSNLNHNNDDWIYHQNNESLLQEPVPFEDFKFSFNNDLFSTASFVSPYLFQQDLNTTTVLNENDQKTFSNFLDTFFVEEEMEEKRRNSILKSLDEQKKLRVKQATDLVTQNSVTNKIYLRKSTDTIMPTINKKRNHYQEEEAETETEQLSIVKPKRAKAHKELLTEEEKRANHIASEQKRRSIIRHGFNELTELVPTLKNINNSKSTVLFKAAEFISHLERRNKSLREKIRTLELRVKVEQNSNVHLPAIKTTTISNHHHHHHHHHYQQQQQQQKMSSPKQSALNSLEANARNALLAHKSQQKQLLLLQEQLQLHQRLLVPKNKLPPIHIANKQSEQDLLSMTDK